MKAAARHEPGSRTDRVDQRSPQCLSAHEPTVMLLMLAYAERTLVECRRPSPATAVSSGLIRS
jgi:hypothetical protein